MNKKMTFKESARSKMLAGAEKVESAVGATLGYCGLNVVIENSNGSPTSTKDGVTVAKAITLEDPVENMGAQLLIETASKTNQKAGDNTTTSTVLAYAIAKEGMKAINAGVKPMELKRGIDSATIKVIEKLEKISHPVETSKEITDVATISANNDPEIGSLLAEAIEKIGKDGVITVEESKNMETTVKITEGLQWDNGWLNPYFCTNRERMEVEYDNAAILITDRKISAVKDLVPTLEGCAKAGKPLVIIADDVEAEALGTLVVNSVRGSLKVAAVKAPSYGNNRKAMLEDIAILTGGKFISEELDDKLDDTTVSKLGTAKIKITKDTTTITNGGGNKETLNSRIEELKKQFESAEGSEKSKYKERLAKLTGGVAVISVGAATETEMKEKKFRIEDTIAATKAALSDGIVPGGGVALVNARDNVKLSEDVSDDFKRGEQILLKAVEAPLKRIVENADINGDVVLNNIISNGKVGYGYNVKTDKYVDMIKDGVLDTTLGIASALMNASSAAGMLLTTDCVITNIPEEEKSPLIAQPMMM